MAKYIGRGSPYGIFEKQKLVPDSITNSFNLLYRVSTPQSILVVYAGVVLEPGVDYSLDNGGTTIVFASVPQTGFALFLTYLGRELAVPSVSGNYPIHVPVTSDGATVAYVLPVVPAEAALLVFVDRDQQISGSDFTLLGNTVTFATAPNLGDHIDFYIHGIERTDLETVDDFSITSNKLAPLSVTADKLNLDYTSYVPSLQTFGGMTMSGQQFFEHQYLDQGKCTKLRLHFKLTLGGSPDNKIRFSLPVLNNGSTNVAGSCTIYSATQLETGIIRWGGVDVLDIYRQFGVNYTLEEWTVEINMEYESA